MTFFLQTKSVPILLQMYILRLVMKIIPRGVCIKKHIQGSVPEKDKAK
jgi:hypothetical protein